MLELSRRHLRRSILAQLEAHDPIRHRWLQEHPQSDAILGQLVTEATELWIEADRVRNDSTSAPSLWTAIDSHEMPEIVLSTLLESPELWPDLAARFPRNPAQTSPPLVIESTIPASAPIQRGWHRQT